MHLEKHIATIFPLTQQLPPTKKNKREPFASQKKTNKHISFRGFFFPGNSLWVIFLTIFLVPDHITPSHCRRCITHFLWKIISSGNDRSMGLVIYTGLHEWLTFMVNVGTLKATNISIHIPPNGKTKNLQKYFGIGNMLFFLVSGKFFPVPPMGIRESNDFNKNRSERRGCGSWPSPWGRNWSANSPESKRIFTWMGWVNSWWERSKSGIRKCGPGDVYSTDM